MGSRRATAGSSTRPTAGSTTTSSSGLARGTPTPRSRSSAVSPTTTGAPALRRASARASRPWTARSSATRSLVCTSRGRARGCSWSAACRAPTGSTAWARARGAWPRSRAAAWSATSRLASCPRTPAPRSPSATRRRARMAASAWPP
eukprot:3132777-Rhodomonas_salina.1